MAVEVLLQQWNLRLKINISWDGCEWVEVRTTWSTGWSGEHKKWLSLSVYYASAAYSAAEPLCFCVVRRGFRPCQIYFFRFTRILNGFPWNSLYIITATKRLNYSYTLGENGTGTTEQDARENLSTTHSASVYSSKNDNVTFLMLSFLAVYLVLMSSHVFVPKSIGNLSK